MAGLCIHPVYLFVCLLDVFLMKLVSLLQTVNWFFAKGRETEVSCSPVELTHVRGHLKCLYVLAYVKACSQHINRSELNTV